MATRIYLPSSGTPSLSPSTWNMPYQAGATYTLPGLLSKTSTTLTSITTAGGTTSGRIYGVMRYVIGPLKAVQISGTVNAVIRASESNAAANSTIAIAVKIIKPDGTDRSVLLDYTASDSATSTYELTTTLSTRRAYDVSENIPITLSAQTPTAGDYLVVELGFRYGSTSNYNIVLRHGDNSTTDCPNSNGDTNDYAPWVEFSQTLSFLSVEDVEVNLAALATNGPLEVSTANTRYFKDASGKELILTGAHTWQSLCDAEVGGNQVAFDYTGWINYLKNFGHNFTRIWFQPIPTGYDSGYYYVWGPWPWQRTGPGNATDGKPKFDLSSLNQDYFDRLRARVIAAGAAGIYCAVMLFDGWGLQYARNASDGHPLTGANNINSVDDNGGTGALTLTYSAVTTVQEAYVEKVIDTIHDLDNVIYEIANEAGDLSTAWQAHFISYITTYETAQGYTHKPVGMTFQNGPSPGTNATLFSSGAVWISPGQTDTGGYDYETNPRPNAGTKVILSDTDHLWGLGGSGDWAWKTFMRGHSPIIMDPHGDADSSTLAAIAEMNLACGLILQYAEKMNLAAVAPSESFSATAYALTNSNVEYLIYQTGTGAFNIYTTGLSGEYTVEWLNPRTGEISTGSNINFGSTISMTPPFSGTAVLYLKTTVFPNVFPNTASDGYKLSDSSSPNLVITKTISDGTKLSETLTSTAVFPNTASDGYKLSDSSSPNLVITKTISDGTKLSDSATNIATFINSISDGTKLSDSSSPNIVMSKSISDGSKLSDSSTNIATFVNSISDGSKLSDSSTNIATFVNSISDGTKLSDSVTNIITIEKSVSDGAKLSDSATNIATFINSISDGTKLSDSSTNIATFVNSISDGSKLSDSSSPNIVMSKSISDGSKLSDSVTNIITIEKSVSDGSKLSDSASPNLVIPESISDGTKLSDSVTNIITIEKSVSDGAKLSETLTYVLLSAGAFNVFASDTFKISESLSSIATQSITATDGVKLSDTNTPNLVITKSVSDGAKLSDSATNIATFINSISDGSKLSDSSTVQNVIAKSISDGIKLSETLANIGTFVNIPSDGIKISDSNMVENVITLSRSDGIKLSETLTYVLLSAGAFNVFASDTFKISESLSSIATQSITATDGVKLSDTNTPNLVITKSVSDGAKLSETLTYVLLSAGAYINVFASDTFKISESLSSIATQYKYTSPVLSFINTSDTLLIEVN